MGIVRLIKLPVSVRGTTVPDEEGNYNIYINKDLSYEMQLETYIHEVTHIINGDFESNDAVKNIERRNQ